MTSKPKVPKRKPNTKKTGTIVRGPFTPAPYIGDAVLDPIRADLDHREKWRNSWPGLVVSRVEPHLTMIGFRLTTLDIYLDGCSHKSLLLRFNDYTVDSFFVQSIYHEITMSIDTEGVTDVSFDRFVRSNMSIPSISIEANWSVSKQGLKTIETVMDFIDQVKSEVYRLD